jgi:putative Holliday junction resolvase
MTGGTPRPDPRDTGERIIALDVGAVRIGVAVSDPTGSFAQGVSVLAAGGDWMEDLGDRLGEYRAGAVLIGMPRRTDGTDGPEAERMKLVAGDLAARFPNVRVIPWDERFTTTMAAQAMLEADVSRKDRRGKIDKVAAVILLQHYLDSLRGGASVPAGQCPPGGGSPRGAQKGGNRRFKNQPS